MVNNKESSVKKIEKQISIHSNLLSIENYPDIWSAFLPLAHLSRILGVWPWSLGKDHVPKVKVISWVTVYTSVVMVVTMSYFIKSICDVRKAIEKTKNSYDLVFLEIVKVMHPICQLIFYIAGLFRINITMGNFAKFQKVIDSFCVQDKEETLKALRRLVMVSTVLYVVYATIFATSIVIGNNPPSSFDWSSVVDYIIKACGGFFQLSYASFGLTFAFITCFMEKTISVLISIVRSPCKCYSEKIDDKLDYCLKLPEKMMSTTFAPPPFTVSSWRDNVVYLNETYTIITDLNEKGPIRFGKVFLIQICLITMEVLICIYGLFTGPYADIGLMTSAFHAVGASVYVAFLCGRGSSLMNEGRMLLREVLKKMKDPDLSPYEKEQYLTLRDNIIHDPLQMNAGNFCIVDVKLIPAIFGAVSTYLVVLIQFKISQQNN